MKNTPKVENGGENVKKLHVQSTGNRWTRKLKKQNKKERDSIKGHKAEAKPTAGEEKV